jgi:hypothetical protein
MGGNFETVQELAVLGIQNISQMQMDTMISGLLKG